jgi:hypothetical protein
VSADRVKSFLPLSCQQNAIMVRYLCIVILLLTGEVTANAQSYNDNQPGQSSNKPVKGLAYVSLGWHRAFYTNSTIHFRNEQTKGYDFRLIRAGGSMTMTWISARVSMRRNGPYGSVISSRAGTGDSNSVTTMPSIF